MSDATTARVRTEIERLHEFLVGWFTGALKQTAFGPDFLERFDSGALLIPPSGATLTKEAFTSGVLGAHDSNPSFRVAIRNVDVQRILQQRQGPDVILATYEEWQRNALASEPPDNGRVATVLFEDTEPLSWLHIHETWLPRAILEAGPYDF